MEWVIVDRLTKTTHFIPGKSMYSVDKWAQLYLKEVVRLHEVPVSVVSDRDARFTSRFWKSLQEALGTQLKFSTAFHPQTDEQTERLNQFSCVHVYLILLVVGTPTYIWWNLPVTIVIRQPFRWLLLKHFMDGGVELRFIGRR